MPRRTPIAWRNGYWERIWETIAKLPLAKDLDDFQFEGTPINHTLVNDLASGGFIAHAPARSNYAFRSYARAKALTAVVQEAYV
jgi:hypothetical protein